MRWRIALAPALILTCASETAFAQSPATVIRLDDFEGVPVEAQCAQAPRITQADLLASLRAEHWTNPAHDFANLSLIGCVARRSGVPSGLVEARRQRIERRYPGSAAYLADCVVRAPTKTPSVAIPVLETCIDHLKANYPQHFEIIDEALNKRVVLFAIAKQEAEEKRADEEQRAHFATYGLMPFRPNLADPNDIADFRKADVIYQRYRSEVNSDPALEEPTDEKSFRAAAAREERAITAAKREILKLRPAAWLWTAPVFDDQWANAMLGLVPGKTGVDVRRDQLEVMRRTGSMHAIGSAARDLAGTLGGKGLTREAIDHARAAVEVLEDVDVFGDDNSLLRAVTILADELANAGRFAEATALLYGFLARSAEEQETSVAEHGGNKETRRYKHITKRLSEAFVALGDMRSRQGYHFAAADEYARAFAALNDTGQGLYDKETRKSRASLIKVRWALALARAGDLEGARQLGEQPILVDSGDATGQLFDSGRISEEKTELFLLLDDAERLRRALARAEGGLASVGFVLDTLAARNRALLLLADGDTQAAQALLAKERGELSAVVGESDDAVRVLSAEIARVHLRQGDSAAALAEARRAIAP